MRKYLCGYRLCRDRRSRNVAVDRGKSRPGADAWRLVSAVLHQCAHHGDRVVATCRRADGSWQRTAINDVDSCNGGIANMNGQLACGRRHGSQYGWSRRDDEPALRFLGRSAVRAPSP